MKTDLIKALSGPAGNSSSPAGRPLLEMTGLSKRYGGVHALSGASLTVSRRGVVHSLIGENGCGKSTLLGILSGQFRPDEGTVTLDGKSVSFGDPADALGAGIAMVSQETAIAPDLSVAENVLLGRLPRRRGRVDRPGMRRRAAEVLERLGLEYDPDQLVGLMRPDEQQLVEIARAISIDVQLLILDEPTSSLTGDEVDGLFEAIRRLRGNGVSILFVSHRIDELFALSDELTVLRDGKTVAAGPVVDFDARSLVQAMVGHAAQPTIKRVPLPVPVRSRGEGSSLLVEGLSSAGALRTIDLQVDAGEIVGLAGLVGAGRSELLETVFGLRRIDAGRIQRDGRILTLRGPRDAITSGIGYVPPNRRTQGLVLPMSIGDNLAMVRTANRWRLRGPDARLATGAYQRACESVRLRAPSRRTPVATLSGGNQQKVAIAKWLEVDPQVLLLDEPTRGVDVAAKETIHQDLRRAADEGMALLVSSSENDELLDLCDRIVVMFAGSIVASLDRSEATEATLARYAGGQQ